MLGWGPVGSSRDCGDTESHASSPGLSTFAVGMGTHFRSLKKKLEARFSIDGFLTC